MGGRAARLRSRRCNPTRTPGRGQHEAVGDGHGSIGRWMGRPGDGDYPSRNRSFCARGDARMNDWTAELSNVPVGADPAVVSNALRVAVLSLNGADALDRETFRREAIAILDAKGIAAAKRYVDAALKSHP